MYGFWRKWRRRRTAYTTIQGLDKTRQDTTRQDKTTQDKTRLDKTGHDKTKQGKTRQDRTRPDETRKWSRPCGISEKRCFQERWSTKPHFATRQDKTRQNKARQDKTGLDETRKWSPFRWDFREAVLSGAVKHQAAFQVTQATQVTQVIDR